MFDVNYKEVICYEIWKEYILQLLSSTRKFHILKFEAASRETCEAHFGGFFWRVFKSPCEVSQMTLQTFIWKPQVSCKEPWNVVFFLQTWTVTLKWHARSTVAWLIKFVGVIIHLQTFNFFHWYQTRTPKENIWRYILSGCLKTNRNYKIINSHCWARGKYRWVPTTDARFRSQGGKYGICGGWSDIGIDFAPNPSVFLCHYHINAAWCSLMYHLSGFNATESIVKSMDKCMITENTFGRHIFHSDIPVKFLGHNMLILERYYK